jgi:hypothetical protein
MKGASAVQAGAGAAATVLAYLYPDRAAAVDELAERGRPRVALELGRSIGARVIARGRRDGSDAGFQGTIRVGPGLWVPTPSAFAPTLEASQGRGDRGTSPRVHGFVPALRRRSEAGATPERCARSTTSRGRSPSQLARDTAGMRSLVSSFGPLKGRVDDLVTESTYGRSRCVERSKSGGRTSCSRRSPCAAGTSCRRVSRPLIVSISSLAGQVTDGHDPGD